MTTSKAAPPAAAVAAAAAVSPRTAEAESKRAWDGAERDVATEEAARRAPKPRDAATGGPPATLPVSLVQLDPGVVPAAIAALQREAEHAAGLRGSLRALQAVLGTTGDVAMVIALMESYGDALAAALVGLRRVEAQRALVASDTGREVRDRVLGRIRAHVTDLNALGRALRQEVPPAPPKATP